MITLMAQVLLEKKGKSRYWLSKETGISYQNLTKMLDNKTKSIRYSTLEVLCQVLECTPNELFLIDMSQPEAADKRGSK